MKLSQKICLFLICENRLPLMTNEVVCPAHLKASPAPVKSWQEAGDWSPVWLADRQPIYRWPQQIWSHVESGWKILLRRIRIFEEK